MPPGLPSMRCRPDRARLGALSLGGLGRSAVIFLVDAMRSSWSTLTCLSKSFCLRDRVNGRMSGLFLWISLVFLPSSAWYRALSHSPVQRQKTCSCTETSSQKRHTFIVANDSDDFAETPLLGGMRIDFAFRALLPRIPLTNEILCASRTSRWFVSRVLLFLRVLLVLELFLDLDDQRSRLEGRNPVFLCLSTKHRRRDAHDRCSIQIGVLREELNEIVGVDRVR